MLRAGTKKATEMVGGGTTRELLDQGVGEICRMVITGGGSMGSILKATP